MKILVPLLLLASTLFARVAEAACSAVMFEPRIVHDINSGNPFVASTTDVNLDGRDDVTIVYNDSRGFQTFLSNADGTLTARPLNTSGGISEVAVGDIDGDGVPDAAHGSTFLIVGIRLFEGNGDGTYAARTGIPLGGVPYEIEMADLNGDGRTDLVGVIPNARIVILLQTAPWTFVAAPELAASHPQDPEIVDLDGDGRLDLAVASGDNTIKIFHGRGDGTFDPVQSVALPSTAVSFGPVSLTVSDLNFDGRPDLVTGIINLGAVLVVNDGGRTYHSTDTIAPNAGARRVEAVDLNADGRNDLVISTFGGFYTVLANADGSFATPVFWQVSELGTGLNARDAFFFKVGDFRGDERNDLVSRVAPTDASAFIATYPNACAPPPTITSITPDSGPAAGGTLVTIRGTSLLSTTEVRFGSQPATIESISATEVVVRTPASSPSIVDVTVTTSGGSATRPGAYRFMGPTTTTVTTEPALVIVDQPFQIVATIAPPISGGTVTFTEGAATLGTAPVVNGRATLTLTSSSVAPRTIIAQFSGTPIHLPSSGSATFRAFLPVAMTLEMSPPPGAGGAPYRLFARLDPPVHGGTVTFAENGNVVGSAPVINGVAFIDRTAPLSGSFTIVATFSGAGDYAPATATLSAHIATNIPTLSELALIALGMMIATIAAMRLR